MVHSFVKCFWATQWDQSDSSPCSAKPLKIAMCKMGTLKDDDTIDECSNSIPSGFLIMCHLRKELFLNHSLLQYMLVVGLVSPLEAMYWSVELVRSCSLIKLAYRSLDYKY